MPDAPTELATLADYLGNRRSAVLQAWKTAVRGDALLTVGDSLCEEDLLDHVPALLATFEDELRETHLDLVSPRVRQFHQNAANHGLKRWQQGYDLVELVRELSRLNECVVDEIDCFTVSDPKVSHASIAIARRVWASFNGVGIEESVRQYFLLQQEEASGQTRDLEKALAEVRALETQRGDIWHQAAHDLRGNLGVVANASVGLTHSAMDPSSRDELLRILIRNVTSLHQLLDDVTGLARLQAGREKRRLEVLDVTPVLGELCDSVRPIAEKKKLYLRCEGPAGLAVQGDAVKLRRIAQNLILNAVKFTRSGGITVSWGDSRSGDNGHWELKISDTGPGFPSDSGRPIASALEGNPPSGANVTGDIPAAIELKTTAAPKVIDEGAGEGLGLSIVKRLCEILDATLERFSNVPIGTIFRVSFPRQYRD